MLSNCVSEQPGTSSIRSSVDQQGPRRRATMARTATVPLSRLFTIQHGNKFDLNKMEPAPPGEDGAAFVGRSGERNGIVAIVRRTAQEPYPAGLITVALGGSTLSSFVQPIPFYTAQNIDVLRPMAE